MTFHKVRIMRNGSFIGLYRPKVGAGCSIKWKLWRVIESCRYDRESEIGYKDGAPFCNESFAIPQSIRLTRANIVSLGKLLGGDKYTVWKRIVSFAERQGRLAL